MPNPFAYTDDHGSETEAHTRLHVGLVVSAPQQNENGLYHVEFRSDRVPSGGIAKLHPVAHGDLYVPEEGTEVLLRETIDGEHVVVKAFYNEASTVPDLSEGERAVSHPTSGSVVTFHEDGSLTIDGDAGQRIELDADSDVVINEGTVRPITNVTTTTDSDGHVTSISLERAPNVFVPDPSP